MFEALSLLVNKSVPHSKGYNPISILYFLFRSGARLKVTYNPLQKRILFCRSIYVTKVMKLLAFIFEQPLYSAVKYSS